MTRPRDGHAAEANASVAVALEAGAVWRRLLASYARLAARTAGGTERPAGLP